MNKGDRTVDVAKLVKKTVSRNPGYKCRNSSIRGGLGTENGNEFGSGDVIGAEGSS